MVRIIDEINKQNRFLLMTEGRSMLPLLHPGDIILWKKKSFSSYRIDDIVVCRRRNQLFTHRIVYKASRYVITKGDTNLQSDGKVRASQILGRVDAIKRNSTIIHLDTMYLSYSSLYFQEIVKVNNSLQKKGIKFLFLKGLPLHLYYERTHPKRIYADCDILTDKNSYSAVKKVMMSMGYKLLDDKKDFVEKSFGKVVNGVPVVFDMHTEVVFMMTQLPRLYALYPKQKLEKLTDLFLSEKKMISVHHKKFPVLSGENLTLYLLLHFFHHNFKGLHRLQLLDSVLRREKITKHLLQRIDEFQLSSYLQPGISLLSIYLHTPLKAFKRLRCSPKEIRNLKTQIFDEELRVHAGIQRMKNLFFFSPNKSGTRLLLLFNTDIYRWVFLIAAKRIQQVVTQFLTGISGSVSERGKKDGVI